MVEPRDRAEQADGVGVLRRREQLVHRRALDDLAGIHHRDLVADFGDDAEIVGDQDDGGAAGRLQLAHQLEDLRLQRDIERGGWLVRDQQPRVAGERHRDHDALAHAAGELVRIFVNPPLGRWDVDATQQIDRPLARTPARAAAVAQNRLDDLVADREARIERGHRLLKDHGEPVAAKVAQRLVRRLEQVETVEADRAGDLRALLRQQAHDRQRRHALAAAGFADEAERRAIGDAEIDAVDRVGDAAVVAVKTNTQIADLDEGARVHERFARAAAMLASMTLRSVLPAGFCRVGMEARKWTQSSWLTRSSRSSSPSGSG